MAAFTVTRITSDNASRFAGLLPVELLEGVRVGKYLSFGMLKKDGRKKLLTPVSALVYYREPLAAGETDVLRVKWMYVHEKYRRKGAGDAMLQTLTDLMRDNEITAATVDYYANDSEEAMTALLGKWNFTITRGLLPEGIFLPRDMAHVAQVEKFSGRAKVLSSLPPEEAWLLIRRFFARADYRGFLEGGSLPEDYIAFPYSCYIGSFVGHVNALLLSHRTPKGRLRVEYLHALPGKEKDLRYLLCTFAAAVYHDCPPDTEIDFPIQTLEMRADIDKLFPNQLTGELIEGVLRMA